MSCGPRVSGNATRRYMCGCVAVRRRPQLDEGANMVHSALNLPSLLECLLLGYLKMKYVSKSYTTL